MTFTYLFYKHIMFRHSCGVCHFTNIQRPSDITLADFWGWENNAPGMNDDNKGISLVLINTKRGRELFQMVCRRLETREVDVKNCLQPNLIRPSATHSKRNSFERDYKKFGFIYVLYRYGDIGPIAKIRRIRDWFLNWLSK